MSDPDTKVKRSQARKRNLIARAIKDYGEHKGAFSLKVLPAKKQEYKREKLRVTNIKETDDDDEHD